MIKRKESRVSKGLDEGSVRPSMQALQGVQLKTGDKCSEGAAKPDTLNEEVLKMLGRSGDRSNVRKENNSSVKSGDATRVSFTSDSECKNGSLRTFSPKTSNDNICELSCGNENNSSKRRKHTFSCDLGLFNISPHDSMKTLKQCSQLNSSLSNFKPFKHKNNIINDAQQNNKRQSLNCYTVPCKNSSANYLFTALWTYILHFYIKLNQVAQVNFMPETYKQPCNSAVGHISENTSSSIKKKTSSDSCLRSSFSVSFYSAAHIFLTCAILIGVCGRAASANSPPRFVVEGGNEIVVNKKEGPSTPIGEY